MALLRQTEIRLVLLGPQHDLWLDLTYSRVLSYSLCSPHRLEISTAPLRAGHGDLLGDEVKLSERGLVIHEIEFSRCRSCYSMQTLFANTVPTPGPARKKELRVR
jgi:hypothetical protein